MEANQNNPARIFCESWLEETTGTNRKEDILSWIEERNNTVLVDIKRIPLSDSDFWFYDKATGMIANRNRSFFQIAGIRETGKDGTALEQPIIIQDEIGYLGILCKAFDGVLHFLMQAKIEPGNVNKIQLSPTIQATKSNFTRRHGGKEPAYLEYFINASRYDVIADQIQSEQSSRFLKKRNRNIIVMLGDDTEVEELPTHRWMTLGQIKALMRIDNLVNMDTRTVLSCIPFCEYGDALNAIMPFARDVSTLRSFAAPSDAGLLPRIYQCVNNHKMFDERVRELVPLYSLKNWEMRSDAFACKDDFAFRVIFCDIAIEGREVRHWTQPLFEAAGTAIFGLFSRVKDGIREFLVCARHEIGCFDGIELGPTVQLEAGADPSREDEIARLFLEKLERGEGALYDVTLSEEGGRFYHEQNRNAIVEIGDDGPDEPPEGYFWVNCGLLNRLTRINNCLNIQLRNLLSLLEA
jgi:oxidase EvaA